jgi:pentatricopeptide repeat protein
MAYVYCALGNYEKALEIFKKAHQVFLSVFGEKHYKTQNTAEGIRVTEQMLDKK